MLFSSTQFLLSATLLVSVSTLPSVHSTWCYPKYPPYYPNYCTIDQHCCDYDTSKCCDDNRPWWHTLSEPVLVMIALLVLIFIFFFILIFVIIQKVCLTFCLRPSSSRGIDYSPAGSTNPDTGRLPPYQQQQQQLVLHSQHQQQSVLHPQQQQQSVLHSQHQQQSVFHPQQQQQSPLYSQQTPYPPQDPINPFYGGPPPPSYDEVLNRVQDSVLLHPKTPQVTVV